MGRYEVTQAEYLAVMKSNPSAHQPVLWSDLLRPVEMVTWYDATNYCGKLTAAEQAAGRLPAGYAYRLPTEAEWEYACRAGTTTRFSYGDDPGYAQLAGYAWYESNSGNATHTVGEKLPNPWGLHDMYGNVWERCLNWASDRLPGGSVADPTGPVSGSLRIMRGGSWGDGGQLCRSAFRGRSEPGYRNGSFGFRAVLAPQSPPVFEVAQCAFVEAGLKLVFAGVAGAKYTVEASDDLTNWQSLGSVTSSTTVFQIIDQDAPSVLGRCYYRAKKVQ
jgi:formylglycine-generating enzyme required for sulfatase activity